MHPIRRTDFFSNPENYPSELYKYRTWNDQFHKDTLYKLQLYFSSPVDFEDPLDCKIDVNYSVLSETQIWWHFFYQSINENPHDPIKVHQDFARYWFDRTPLRNPNLLSKLKSEKFAEYCSQVGILSLTTDPKNIHMWAKYSDNGNGFCISFNPAKLLYKIGGGGKVKYFKKLPELTPKDSLRTQAAVQVLSKEIKWSFEKEYRTFIFKENPLSNAERILQFEADDIESIILGYSLTKESKNEIIQIAKAISTDLQILVAVKNGNKIEIQEYCA